MNVNIKPLLHVYVRKEFLYNLEKGHGEFEEGYIFGACALKSRPILFHVHLKSGAKFMRLPINAFCVKKEAPLRQIGDLQLWDCLSGNMECITYDYFKNYEVSVRLGSGDILAGTYITTFDFLPEGGLEETPDQHKDFNLIELADGNFAIQPNNRILWVDEHFTGKTPPVPDYKVNQKYWLVERHEDLQVSDSDAFYYHKRGDKL